MEDKLNEKQENFENFYENMDNNLYDNFTEKTLTEEKPNTEKKTLKEVHDMIQSDEFPELVINDGNLCFKGKNKFLYNFEGITNKCRICKKNDVDIFCKSCRIHFCKNCAENCIKNHHQNLFNNLRDKKISTDKIKFDIKNILSKYFIKPDKKENKENINNKKIDKIPDDVEIINAIIEKDYLNYFHFQNIDKCEEYLKGLCKETYNEDCLKIIYKFNNIKRKEFKILGNFFVENNKDNIDLIINGKVFGLDENLKINNHSVEIILRQKMDKDKKKFINNMSCMFCDCEANEIEFSEVKNAKLLDLSQVTDISKMFKNCSNLDKIDLKFLENSRQVIRIDYLFSNCKNLKDVFHIDSLDTKSVINMYRVFNGCSGINNINDLNNWKINNVDNFNEMFEGCTSLTNIPDISKWDVKNVKSMKRMFKGCIALKEIPDISKWDVGNVKSLKGMFKGCTALTKIPNISKWDVKNVTSMKGMFKGCICLKNFPDLTAWKQKLINLKSIEKMFYGCRNLIYTEKNTIENFLKLDNIDNISSGGAFDDSMP